MTNRRGATILGSTGSIGTQALEVISALGWPVVALTAQRSGALLEEQARRFRPRAVALADETAARALKTRLRDMHIEVLAGAGGVEACAAMGAELVLNGIVGIAGLRPSVAALQAGSRLALANKESLVAGGQLLQQESGDRNQESGDRDQESEDLPRIVPVDSEHSAIFQCMRGLRKEEVSRVILTASGGAFYGKSREELAHVTLEDALRHPVWKMGAKITIDSATMFNKGLEVMEAAWLFDLPPERVNVVVHRQSVVHSMVECVDGAVLAQLGTPDMRLPIQYALTYPARVSCPAQRLNLAAVGTLTFEPPDDEAFPAVQLCRKALAMGGLAGATLNAANEAANALFRAGKIGFLEITELVAEALERTPNSPADTLENIFAADQAAREFVMRRAGAPRPTDTRNFP